MRWPPAWITFEGLQCVGEDALAKSIKTETSLAEELGVFGSQLADVSNRTVWEDTADWLRAEGRLSDAAYRSLMRTRTRLTYHWGCVLYDKDKPVRVQRSSRDI